MGIRTALISLIVVIISYIWMLIEFIIYLTKDHEFNWVSFGLFIASFVCVMVCIVCMGIKEEKERTEKKANNIWKKKQGED